MSTDSSELTFVRCPSCRSLVPAVSTRCRMCGASLEASGKMAEEESSQKPKRVRQRTTSSGTDGGFAEAKERVRAESDVPEEVPEEEPYSFDQGEAESESEAMSDPLGAFMEEGEEPVEQEEGYGAEEAEAPPVFGEIEAEEAAPEAEFEPEPADDLIEEEEAAAPLEEEALKEEPVEEPEEDLDENEPTMVIETGRGSRKGKRRLSFSKPVEEEEPEESIEEEVAASEEIIEEQPYFEEIFEEASEVDETVEEPEDEIEEELVQAKEEIVEEEPEPEEALSKKRARSKERVRKTRNRSHSERPVVGSQLRGRLFGWLVSYASSDGTATELREGKFFVSSTQLKGNELIIDDDSISTPHALVTVSIETGFQIQDLLSERGVFWRRSGEDTYSKQEGIVRIDNGDWIRLGDVEFLVSLIPYVGEK